MTVNVFPAFAVPMADIAYPEPAALNTALMQLILSLEAQGAGYRNPDPVVHQPDGLFESEFDFFAREERCVQELRTWVWGALGEFLRNINPQMAEGARGLRIASQTWFHVTRDGGFPPLNLDMIDFMAMYRQQLAARAQQAQPAAPVS